MKKQILFLILLTLLILLIIVALFYKSNGTMNGNLLLKELICDFPCWQEITPQETTFAEALSKLQDKDLVRIADENEIDFQVHDISGSVNKSGDRKVGFIILYMENQSARLRDVVQLVGEPEKILMDNVQYPSNNCYILLVFPQNGTLVELYLHNSSRNQSTCQVNIAPNSQSFRIILLGYDLYSNDYWKRSFEGSEFIEWKGYGTYSE